MLYFKHGGLNGIIFLCDIRLSQSNNLERVGGVGDSSLDYRAVRDVD